MNKSRDKFVLGVFALFMGLNILLAAFGYGLMSDSAIYAPRWVVGIAGLVFLSCGVMLFDTLHRLASLMAGIVTVGMAVICAWVALFGEDAYFSGGLSMVSQSAEVLIARIIFGLVALLGAAVTLNALRKSLQKDHH